MITLTDMTLTDFCTAIASKEPAPGGGSVAAMSAAMGIGLVGMVAQLTIGRKKYAEHQDLMQEIIVQSEELRHKLVSAIDRDTLAYNEVAAVFSMPKETDADKAARAAAMEISLKAATAVPQEVMGLCLAALDLAEKAVGRSNTNAASDLGVAAHTLLAGAHGAWMNVLINLSGIRDAEFVQQTKTDGAAIIKQAEKSAEAIISYVMAEIF